MGCRKIGRPLRKKSGQNTKEAQQEASSQGRIPIDFVEFDDFMMAAPQSSTNALSMEPYTVPLESQRPLTATPTIADEEDFKQVYNVTYNEQAWTRRNSYQDLCESIMGKDCEACKDGAMLMEEIMQHDNIQPRFAI